MRKAALYKQLYKIKKGESMTQYINNFQSKAELENAGIKLSDKLSKNKLYQIHYLKLSTKLIYKNTISINILTETN